MMWIIVGALVVAGLAGVFFVALARSSKRSYAAANEVVPGAQSSAPASWAGDHSAEARLHRRLVAATAAARTAQVSPSALAVVHETALHIDARLVAAAALPGGQRQPAISAAEGFVAQLEAQVAELVGSRSADVESTMAELQRGLDALAEARAEVERIDRSTT